MTTELLHIEPSELRFVFELKKQSSCLVQLGNKVDQYIAFKVKTTSPKKYCVRPNIGIIKPKEKFDFTVTMQAQRTAPPDMQCKDKFLIQTTVVPFGATKDDITSDMFAKDSGKYIEEKKLRVVLISPPSSQGRINLEDPFNEINMQKDRMASGVENIPPPHRVSSKVKDLAPAQDMTSKEDADYDIVRDLITTDHEELNVRDMKPKEDDDESVGDMKPKKGDVENVGDMKPEKDDVELNLATDREELKSRLCIMDSKLREAEITIMKLNKERRTDIQEKELLKKELEVLKRKVNAKVQAGFPLLFVCMIALVGMVVGYYIHPLHT